MSVETDDMKKSVAKYSTAVNYGMSVKLYVRPRDNLKRIAVSPAIYDWLKDQGRAGDSFNDVIIRLREDKEKSQAGDFGGHQQATTNTTGNGGNSQE